jgi:hypothetical protein
VDDSNVQGTVEERERPATREEVLASYTGNRDLRSLRLIDGHYDRLSLPEALLAGAQLFRTILQDSDLTGADLRQVCARRAVCINTTFKNANLSESDWTDADLSHADLESADLRGCILTPGTSLKDAKVAGAKIDSRSLKMLGDKRGGLTEADVAKMIVTDDQTRLATSFGGFWTTLHLVALTLFISPYLIFGIRRYVTAQFVTCLPKDCISLRSALWDYIITGGNGSARDRISITLFFSSSSTIFFAFLLSTRHERSSSPSVPQESESISHSRDTGGWRITHVRRWYG